MTKTTILITAFFLSTFNIIFAQNDTAESKNFEHEIGLNVTNLLTDLLGNNNRSDPGTYLISYKHLRGKRAFRVGLNVNYAFKNTDNGFGQTIKLVNQNIQLRMGKEWRRNITPKFQSYFGFDGLAGLLNEESTASVTNNFIVQKDRTLIFGAGPVLGFQFAIFDGLLIGTEGSLYATYNSISTTFETFSNFQNPPARTSNGLNIQTNLPKSLFLILKF